MAKAVKGLGCVILCLVMLLSLSGCSGNNELTEENVNATVEAAATALKEFDTKALDKYVDSTTLSYILKLAEEHEQFSKLGKSIFENLEIKVKSIDLEGKTVTVEVKNKRLALVASRFTQKLLEQHNKLALINLLSDEGFLNNSLGSLVDEINEAEMQDEGEEITLKIVQKKKNLALSFDDDAENAVSGGALKAIKSLI